MANKEKNFKISRILRKGITVPSSVTVSFDQDSIAVKGPKGSLSMPSSSHITLTQSDGQVFVKQNRDTTVSRAQAAMVYRLLSNMVTGTHQEFRKNLKIVGVGYRAKIEGKSLQLNLGYSHPVKISIPQGLSVETPTQTEIIVSGVDKQQVGQLAANIRAYRPPEPYKGKGIMYSDENILRKQAKKK